MKLKSYKEALEYLNGFISPIIFKRIEDDVAYDPLDRVRTFLGLLGNPERKFKSILVTGTAGKGSTSYLISHILKTAGYKVGLTISPHLQRINERLQINGKEITDEKFVELLTSMIRIIEVMKKMPACRQGGPVGAPSYFEILIALAFLYFSTQKIDIAVVEVGIEGKYDATNVLNPLIVVLTNIYLDHTQILGDTVEKIAGEAVGAIKGLRIKDEGLINNSSLIIHHLLVVTGVTQPSVIEIVEERCREVGAELLRLEKDFNYKIRETNRKGSTFDLIINSDRIKKLNDLRLSLIGRYQVENASLAVEAVRRLADFGFNVSEKNIRQALSTAFFPGRFEIINLDTKILRYRDIKNNEENPPNILASQYSNISIILDGAHNPAKMKAFISSLQKLFPKERKIFIIAFKSDKNIKEMLEEILPVADVIIATKFHMATDVSRNASANAESIKKDIKILRYRDTKAMIEEDSKKALALALNYPVTQLPNYQSIVVVTGSLYLVGEVRSLL